MPIAFLSSLISFLSRRSERKKYAEVEAIYQKYGYILHSRCHRILRDAALVDDALQEIFLALLTDYKSYRGEPDAILPWLYRVTNTHCFRLIDKNKRWSRLLAARLAEQGPSSHTKKPELDERLTLETLLEKLPEQERMAVLYRYISGMTQEEIAEVMEVSRDRVRRWLQHFQKRGRVLLRNG